MKIHHHRTGFCLWIKIFTLVLNLEIDFFLYNYLLFMIQTYWTVGLSIVQLSQVVLMVVIRTSTFPKGFQKLRRMDSKTTSSH